MQHIIFSNVDRMPDGFSQPSQVLDLGLYHDPTSRPVAPSSFHAKLSELQHFLYEAIMKSCRDGKLIEELQKNEKIYKQQLNGECIAHAMTRYELETERRFHQEVAEANALLNQKLFNAHNAIAALNQAVAAEKERHQTTLIELENLRRWCHRVDSLIDVMRVEEDSRLEMDSRSRRIGNIIMDIESKIGAQYKAALQERDDRITELQRQLNSWGNRCVQTKEGKTWS